VTSPGPKPIVGDHDPKLAVVYFSESTELACKIGATVIGTKVRWSVLPIELNIWEVVPTGHPRKADAGLGIVLTADLSDPIGAHAHNQILLQGVLIVQHKSGPKFVIVDPALQFVRRGHDWGKGEIGSCQ